MSAVFDFVRQRKNAPIPKEETINEEPIQKKVSIFDVARKSPRTFEPQPSTTQKVASSAPTQAALGTLKRFTWPFDVLKAAALGEGLSGVEEIEEIAQRERVPFDRQNYLKKVFEAAEALPTQDMAEKFIQEKTGLDLSAKGKIGKIARKGGEFLSLTTPGSLLEEGAKGLAKKGAGAVTGATLAEGATELGVPEPIADIIGLGTAGGISTGKMIPKELKGEAKKARETAEKFELRKIRGVEHEEVPKIPAVVSPERQKKVTEELGKTSQKAIEKIIEGKLPIKTLEKQGWDLEDIYSKSYQMARDRATSKPSEIDIQPVLNWMEDEYKRINKHTLSPSGPDKIALKILEDEYKALHPSVKGKPSAEQVLNQYHKFNENLKGIYKKPEFSGAEEEIRRVYGAMNEKLIDSLEKSGRFDILVPFRVANKAYHETSKLNQVEGILSKAFEDGYNPKKLSSILDAKTSKKYLERSLGKDSIRDMKLIADYGKRAEEMVLSKLKNPKTVGQYVSELTPMKAALLFLKHIPGGTVAIPYEAIKGGIQRAQGLLMTKKGTLNAYKNFLKGASTGSQQAFKTASQSLTKAIEKEFGSEEEFLKMFEEEESSKT